MFSRLGVWSVVTPEVRSAEVVEITAGEGPVAGHILPSVHAGALRVVLERQLLHDTHGLGSRPADQY